MAGWHFIYLNLKIFYVKETTTVCVFLTNCPYSCICYFNCPLVCNDMFELITDLMIHHKLKILRCHVMKGITTNIFSQLKNGLMKDDRENPSGNRSNSIPKLT